MTMQALINHVLVAPLLILVTLTAAGGEPTGMDAVLLMEQGKAKEALQILEKLAAQGETRAMVQLGLYSHEGTGVKQDYAKAMDWYLQAFAKQDADAFVNLGVMHRDGQAVPQNKKIAYCVFLTTHMCGLGSESTQIRSNSCLRRIMEELSKDDIKDCLSNYTLPYITAYLEARGQMRGVPAEYKPSQKSPALRDLDWWLDGELDAICGKPTKAEKKARQEREEQLRRQIADVKGSLVFQVRFAADTADQYRSYDLITDQGMSSGPISERKLTKAEEYAVYQDSRLIFAEQRRYLTIETQGGAALVYEIDHPVKPEPCDWNAWQKPAYVLKASMDKFALMGGGKPTSGTAAAADGAPELRFKVVKE